VTGEEEVTGDWWGRSDGWQVTRGQNMIARGIAPGLMRN